MGISILKGFKGFIESVGYIFGYFKLDLYVYLG